MDNELSNDCQFAGVSPPEYPKFKRDFEAKIYGKIVDLVETSETANMNPEKSLLEELIKFSECGPIVRKHESYKEGKLQPGELEIWRVIQSMQNKLYPSLSQDIEEDKKHL